MLPEALSNELCSLKPGVDRACMAVRLHINANGKITDFEFMRGLMRSHARLTYNQVQLALEGQMDATTGPLYESVIQPLYGVFQALLKARHHRGTIDFDLPEYQVFFNNDHNLSHIASRVRLKSHQLIEELMIAANVAAAMTLKEKKWPCLYRIHDEPDPQRFENLKAMLKAYKLAVPAPKKLTPHFFNQVLAKVQGHHAQTLINQLMLRCQAQAVYGPDPKASHFGLSLAHYTHFTSPIRRYSDLVVHRALIGALGLGEGGEATPPSLEKLQAVGMHLSQRERVAVQAERETMERYVAAWMADKVGQIFDAQIVGINRAGLFVGLSRWGAEGFLSVSNLTGDYFVFEEHLHRFVGRHTRQVYQLGDFIRVKLEVADPISSSISFRLANTERPQTSQVKNGVSKAKARKKGYNQEESVGETPSRKKPYKQKNPEPPKPPRGKNLNGRNPRKGSATESLTKGNPHQPRPSQKKGKKPRAIP
jgi:ribonuclease R